MRIRTIKPEFFLHEELYELELELSAPVRVAYAGLWCAADRAGRFDWKPRALGVQILPYDCAAGLDFSRVLDACLTRGFLTKYRVGADWFGAIPSWRKHQFINNRESESKIPDIAKAEEVAHACPTRAPRVPHATEGEGEGEGKGKEGEGKEISTRGARVAAPEALPFSSPEFAEAWASWGKHRTEIRKPLKPTSRKAQLRELATMGEARAIDAINHTIAKGWQGIREPDVHQGQLPIGAARVQGATKLSDYAPRPSLGALQIELKGVRDEIYDLIHPGGCAQSVEPTGEKRTRYDSAIARRDRIQSQINTLT